MQYETVTLPAFHTLTVTADAFSAGRVWPFVQRVGDSSGVTTVAASGSAVLGPFSTAKRYQLESTSGRLAHSIAPVDFPTAAEALAEAVAAAAAAAALAHVPVVGTVGDVREFIGEGVPTASARASLTINPTGNDNALTFAAVVFGEAGNDIAVEYIDPGEANVALGVELDGNLIMVTLATDSEGAITTTAADVLAAIEAHEEADALVTVANSGIDDGSGVVTVMSEASLTGGDGIGVGVAGKGSRYTDIDNGTLYLNTGTKAEPVWTQLAPVE